MFLSIDYGTRKSGLAYSVEDFAFSCGTVATIKLIETIQKLIQDKDIKTIIIGMPYNIDGTMSTHGKRAEKFGKVLDEMLKKMHLMKISIPNIIFHDERLTSSKAHMSFIEDGIDGDIDAEAARLILEDYIKDFQKKPDNLGN